MVKNTSTDVKRKVRKNEIDPDYKSPEYKDTGAKYIDNRRRLFYDNFVILQAEFVEYERYLVEIVNKNDFEDDDSLQVHWSKKSKK